MRRDQQRRPFYRRLWLWLVVIFLLIGGTTWMISTQHDKGHNDTVVKTTEKAKKAKKVKKKATKKAAQHSKSPANNQQQEQEAATTSQFGSVAPSGDVGPENSQAAAPSAGSSSLEPWVDPDNYEPNSVIGDRSTMRCYLPGQNPSPAIAAENIVYFDSLAEAQAAGYQTVQ
ncbi:hypothetical protein [Limosilactobacillus difficilis]|uniref:hypothetical protein n=1 Tax=Limosilactobacillus difficilis TaxID=2991838 RepID=UPI0024BBDA4A|nr:hypothetical protein [Limosilactobacillus difficilis]